MYLHTTWTKSFIKMAFKGRNLSINEYLKLLDEINNRIKMKKTIFFISIIIIATCCKQGKINQIKEDNKEFANLLDKYYDDRMQMLPLDATINGDSRYNNLLPAYFTDSYRKKLTEFFHDYQISLSTFNRAKLNANDKISFDILNYEIDMSLEGLVNHHLWSSDLYDNTYIPFDQFRGVPLLLGQMGGGTGYQPFNTIADYVNWLQRATAFSSWTDSAIVYFKKGIAASYVLPKAVVLKMIPQMQAMVTDSATKSIFYGPVKSMPANFSDNDRKRLTFAYENLINQQIVPSYRKLAVFLQTEYLPNARNTTGINASAGRR